MYENIEFVVCAAGTCSRNYPHAKAVAHKALLPMGDKRIIDYVLQDIIRIGGRHITFVCSNKRAVQAFQAALTSDEQMVQKLRKKNLADIANTLQETFLPKNVDLKFVIQKEPLGTAHVLYAARQAIRSRHVVLIFPDDILISHNPKKPHMKRLLDSFLKNPKKIMLTSLYCKDVSNNAILVNGRLVEKPKNPTTHIAGWDPNVLPNQMVRFLIKQAPLQMKKARTSGKEWRYTDAVNDFLDHEGAQKGYYIEMFLKDDKDIMIDTGNLFLYEQCLLEILLNHSRYQKQNRTLAKKILAH